MTHDWLLVETLGSEPAVVAQGLHTKNVVPVSAFLRRNPHLMAVQTAIGETVHLRPQSWQTLLFDPQSGAKIPVRASGATA